MGSKDVSDAVQKLNPSRTSRDGILTATLGMFLSIFGGVGRVKGGRGGKGKRRARQAQRKGEKSPGT